jgi:hypothetical protein
MLRGIMENKDFNEEFEDLIKKRLIYSFQLSDSLDSKAATILGFGGIIFSLLLSIVFSNKEVMNLVIDFKFFSLPFKTVFFFGIVLVFSGIYFEVASIRTEKFWITPNIIKIYEELKNADKKNKESIMKTKFGKIIKSYKHNMKINKNKIRNIDRGLCCIIIGLFVNLIALFFYFYY